MPLILSGNVASAVAGAYEVANSCRFNDDDSAHMTKSSSAGVNDKGTLSVWIKRGNLGTDQNIYNPYTSSNTLLHIYFASDNTLKLYVYDNGSTIANLVTDAEYRDCSAWLHIVLAIDSDQGTAENRMKLYVNGTQVTSFSSSGYPDSGADMQINNSGTTEVIGRYQDGTQKYFDGYMAEFVWIDGTQYAASDFGEFDEDSPTIWKPKDVSGLTFGTNGYYLDFEDSANLGNDANGGTDLTENNLAATDQCTDTPTNNFATLNPLMRSAGATYAEGNTYYAYAGNWQKSTFATFAPTAGKWYFEWRNEDDTAKEVAVSNSTFALNGLVQLSEVNADTYTIRESNHGVTWYTYNTAGKMIQNGSDIRTDVGQLGNDDIGMFAFDCATGKIWTGKAGTWDNSGDPAGDSNPSATWSTNFTVGEPTFFTFGSEGGNALQVNFGNPPFSISSGNSDANGYGNFEYAVPSGFLALCSKNLGSDGG